MKLTEKDMLFLDRLRGLLDEKGLWVEKRRGVPSYFVLRGNYGDKISDTFHITRQGVRWRFWHIFNTTYIAAYETVFMIERNFGASLRNAAMQISRERYLLREKAKRVNCANGSGGNGGHAHED